MDSQSLDSSNIALLFTCYTLINNSTKSSGLDFLSVNHTTIYKNSELKGFKSITFLGVIFNNWKNDLLGTNI